MIQAIGGAAHRAWGLRGGSILALAIMGLAATPLQAQVSSTGPGNPPQSGPGTGSDGQPSSGPLAPEAEVAENPQTVAPVTESPVTAGDVIVTGSRIIRNGNQAPTPTTVVSVEEIQKAAPVNIANYVNTLPQLAATTTPRTGNAGTSGGTNGINSLNLRSLGVNRTLVLLDGQRVAPASTNGAVDVNNLPSALVQRVEVVTGGASAAYGSDAVAGVVNFILDSRFQGLKGQVSGGINSRGDGETVNVELAGGLAFADGRGHILASGEYAWSKGIDFLDPDKRDWFQQCNQLTFAATARPQRITACGVNTRGVTRGGVILTTALANTVFGDGGAISQFVLGSPADTLFMVGGTPYTEGNTVALEAGQKRYSAWSRVSYDLSDTITARVEGAYGYSRSRGSAAYQRYNNNTALEVRATNAFLDPAFQARAATLGVTTFRYGYSTLDLGRPVNFAERESYRGVASLEGKIGEKWRWNAYYQYGQTDTAVELRNTTITARLLEAIDAVRNPAGQIVCRSTLTAPGNGCVPLNIFGVGVANPAAVAYVKGTATQDLTFKQQVAAATVTGDVFEAWAGPLSVATGVEWRKEQVEGTSDALSLTNGYFTGNFKPTFGSFNVKEVFGEVNFPLIRDASFTQSLELNGAARYTDYSLSGTVTTWKAGVSWVPIEDIRIRGVLSRDIRAPNTGELFAAGATSRTDAIDTLDPARPTYSVTRITSGNTDLRPEIARTQSLGVVLRPRFLPQFSAAIDYYRIKIDGAIATVNNQDTVDRCARGETALCALIIRGPNNAITQILGFPVNVASTLTRGIDFEASWRQDLGAYGTLTLRGLATRTLDFETVNGTTITDTLGQNTGATPKWRYFASLGWDWNRLSITGQMRGFSAGVYDNTWRDGIEIDNNRLPGATYFQLSGSYRILGETSGRRLVAFATVENLFDKDPAIVAANSLSGLQTNPTLYDTIGRAYRAGLRFQY